MLIIDKPAGLVTHPSPGRTSGTLVNALLARGGVEAYGTVAGDERPGIVHRLDRDTSGLIVVARNDRAQAALMAQLKARRVKKTYLALVQGAAGRGRPDRGAHRPRPAPLFADGRDRRRPSVRHRLPGARALPRLDAARGRPDDRPHAPDPRPPRVDRPSDRGRPGLRDGRRTARPGRPRAAVPALVAHRVRVRRRRTGSSARRRRCPPELETVLDGLREGGDEERQSRRKPNDLDPDLRAVANRQDQRGQHPGGPLRHRERQDRRGVPQAGRASTPVQRRGVDALDRQLDEIQRDWSRPTPADAVHPRGTAGRDPQASQGARSRSSRS